MAVTNNLRKQIDLPVWEWLRFAQVATAATSALCYGEGTNERYLYYLSGTFWRYDTWTDGWEQLASPNIAPVTAVKMKYSSYGGYRGNILSATATTLTIAGLQGDLFDGRTIRITAGTGISQRVVITSSDDNVIKDHGILTSATNASITDTTKRWAINQWIGYSVRLVFGTGQSQVRKVLYNDATNLYFYDINYQQLEPWNNTVYSAVAPYAIPTNAAGSQATYYIESTTLTVPTLSPIPDASSSYVIEGGGIWLLSAVAGAPWSSWQYYDVLSDTWTTKTALGGHLLAALGTDFSIERTGEYSGAFVVEATATSGGVRTITNTNANYPIDVYTNYQIRITAGTGIGQRSRIAGNTATVIETENPWDITPDNTSKYEIWGNTDQIYLIGNGSSSMYKYSVEGDYWYTGNTIDYGQTINMYIKYSGQESYAMTTGVRNTGGITVLKATPTAGGTGYAVGDLFNITTGGTIGKGRVTSVAAGVVTGVALYSAGLTYTTGAAKATTIISGAGNNALTVEITTVGTVGRITSVQNLNLCQGDTITIGGCTESAWNTNYSVLAIDSLTTFDILLTATANAAATASQSVTLIVDSSKSWVVNEHAGKVVHVCIAGTSPTTQSRRITSNTATTLTVANIVAAVNGTSRYVIQQPNAFGRDEQWKVVDKKGYSRATGGTATTLVDSTKNWYSNQWNGYKVRIVAGTGVGSEVAITGNDATTLTLTAPGFVPDATTKYILMDTFGILTGATNVTNAVLTDTTKNWTVNQWAGKRIRLVAGAGAPQEATITSNTSNALTIAGVFTTTPDTTTVYTILAIPARGAGIEMNWIHGTSLISNKGRYILCPRGGGSNLFDRYDIPTSTWDLAINTQPHTEIFTTGTMYAYDGADTIIIHRGDAVATMRTFIFNVNTLVCHSGPIPPYNHGAPTIGNRMEIITTVDGLKYLYLMRHTGQEMWRVLLFWQKKLKNIIKNSVCLGVSIYPSASYCCRITIFTFNVTNHV